MPNVLEHPRKLIRFADFVLDPVSGELRHGENTVRLQPQPLKLLLALLQRPGELVTRDELKQELMPDAAYGDFDHAINLAVSKLRAALNDPPDSPELIETLPRRGYRFVGKIEAEGGESGGPALVKGKSRPWLRRGESWAVVALLVLAAGAAIFFYVRKQRAPIVTERDTIVLADFTNKTGDPVFTDTLRQALAVQLSQSPFLNILSDTHMRQTMQQMGRQPQDPAVDEVARELCLRTKSKVYVAGSIASVGSDYVVGLKAINCATGEAVFQEQAEVSRKENVLKTLGKQATVLRYGLGESMASLQKFNTPLEEATTSSLEALQAYSLGVKQRLALDFSAAAALYQRAVELDPNFAIAHAHLAAMLRLTGKDAEAQESSMRAFSLRHRVTERERFYIESAYYLRIGDLENARHTVELWASLYPQDGEPYLDLAVILHNQGQHEDAYWTTREALKRSPNQQIRRALTYEAIESNHFDEAEKALAEAEAAQRAGEGSWDPLMTATYSYEMAFLRHDTLAMEKIVLSAPADSKFKHWLLFDRSQTEAYYGRVRRARELNRRAINWALELDRPRDASLFELIPQALWEANFGNLAEARQLAGEAQSIESDKDVKAAAGLALARSGDFTRAGKLADDLAAKYPSDTLLQRCSVPMIRAAIASGRNHPAQAVALLQDAESTELGDPQVIYTRGQAFLALHDGSEAAAEFQKIIDHPNFLMEDPLGALAYLGIARAHALRGDRQKARAEYETFLTLWKDADPDVPIYQAAKSEYAHLQ